VKWTVAMMKQVQAAVTTGLKDGTRIEPASDGWVVVDEYGFFLHDPDDAAWVADDDCDDMQPMGFETPEDAYLGWLRCEQVAAARRRRGKKAMERIAQEQNSRP
jgi:hypothetical protein